MHHDLAIPWWLALRVSERKLTPWPASTAAPRKLSRWRDQPPFDQPQLWLQRLQLLDLSERQLAHLLAPPPPLASAPPAWLAQLQQQVIAPAAPPTSHQQRLSTPLLPLIDATIATLQAQAAALPLPPNLLLAPQLWEGLHRQLRLLLGALLGPTLVLELNVARLREQLHGASGAERFADFMRQLCTPARLLELFAEYPVLARSCIESAEQWRAATLRCLTHLAADWPEIAARWLPGAASATLVALDREHGDPHRGGQSVAILTFADTTRLVYKPRSLAVEAQFQRLLAWLNARGATPPLPVLDVRTYADHGWMPFVAAAPCQSHAEVVRFYQRQGAYLALLRCLDATDMHYENIIAAGEYPMLVDLEGILHPHLPLPDLTPAQAAEQASILRTGLLPRAVSASQPRLDLSGLGGAADQLSTTPVAAWADEYTDTMRLEFAQRPLPGGNNRPQLDGAVAESAAFVAEIEAGFRQMYQLLQSQRAALLAADGPLSWFAAVTVRLIARPTQSYAIILHRSYHPNLLRDAADRERWLDHLWQAVPNQPLYAALISAELDDLWRGDIPLFRTTPASRSAWDSRDQPIGPLWETPALEHTRQRIDALSPADCAEQCRYIRQAWAE